MLSGPPLPLPPAFPVWQLLLLLQSQAGTGAWFRGSSRCLRLYSRSTGCRADVLVSGDLGLLLRHCGRILVRDDGKAVLLESELLIQWRALQVVTATPYLPCRHHLQQLFPQAEIDDGGFHVPTRSCSPEAVLADCLIHGIPVVETRIIYDPTTSNPSG